MKKNILQKICLLPFILILLLAVITMNDVATAQGVGLYVAMQRGGC